MKALSHRETGGIVAAGTTSLPEKIGGNRNWDYRYCWLRDATFTLYALLGAGFIEEAEAWRGWLLRAVAGSPKDLQIMYGVAGERRLEEYEVAWLNGYEASSPVRIGNAAAKQIQLDVYGELLDALYVARKAGLHGNAASWALGMLAWSSISKPSGTSRMMEFGRFVAAASILPTPKSWHGSRSTGRSVRSRNSGWTGPLSRWRAIREAIHQTGLRERIRPRAEQLRAVLRLEIA